MDIVIEILYNLIRFQLAFIVILSFMIVYLYHRVDKFEKKTNKLHQAQLKMLTAIERMEKITQQTHPSQHIPTQKEYDEAMKEAEGLNGKKK